MTAANDEAIGEYIVTSNGVANAIKNYNAIFEELDRVQVYSLADKTLQSLGEPVRYCVHKGEPPEVARASGKLEQLL